MLLPSFAIKIVLFAFFSKPTYELLKMCTIKALAALLLSLVNKGVKEI